MFSGMKGKGPAESDLYGFTALTGYRAEDVEGKTTHPPPDAIGLRSDICLVTFGPGMPSVSTVIDLKPGSRGNPINLSGHGKIPVSAQAAVLCTGEGVEGVDTVRVQEKQRAEGGQCGCWQYAPAAGRHVLYRVYSRKSLI